MSLKIHGAAFPSEHDPIWRQSLYKGNPVKMRSLLWALIQYDWCPYKKGEILNTQTHKEKMTCRETEGEDLSIYKEKREVWNRPSSQSSAGTAPTPPPASAPDSVTLDISAYKDTSHTELGLRA